MTIKTQRHIPLGPRPFFDWAQDGSQGEAYPPP